MAKLIPTLGKMIRDGVLPIADGVWIDVYNSSANTEIAGTIHTRISQGNYWFVTEIYEDKANRELIATEGVEEDNPLL